MCWCIDRVTRWLDGSRIEWIKQDDLGTYLDEDHGNNCHKDDFDCDPGNTLR